MGKDVLFINIGNNDILIDIPSLPQVPREKGEYLLLNYEKFKTKIKLPIIEPVLKEIFKRTEILDIVMFATDQEDEKFKKKDTIFYAQIIKKFLDEKKRKEKGFRKLGTIHISDCITLQPNIYDLMLDYYDGRMKKFMEKGLHKSYDRIFVSITGGTPACNFALAFQAVKYFGEKVEIYYSKEIDTKGESIPINLRLGKEISQTFAKMNTKALIEHYDFYGAMHIDKSNVYNYLYYRELFLFEKAKEYLEMAIKDEKGHLQDILIRHKVEIDELLKKDITGFKKKLTELYYNMQLKEKKGEYIDMLTRLYTFIQMIYRLIMYKYWGLPLEDDKFIEECKEKCKEIIEKEKLRLETISLYLLKCIFKNLNTEGKVNPEVESILDNLHKLVSLRHKSIGAHGYEGIDKEDIEKHYGKGIKELFKDIKILLSHVDVSTGENPFYEIRRCYEEIS